VAITLLASLLPIILFLFPLVLWWIDGKKLKEITLHGFASMILSWIVAEFLKSIFQTPRPFLVKGTTPLTFLYPNDPAFPSTHTAALFALGTTIFLHDRKIGSVFLFLSLVAGIARVYAQVHTPVDILAGSLLGAIISLSIDRLHLFHLVKKYMK